MARWRTRTTTLKNGTKVTRAVAANDNVPEYLLQAEQCRQLRAMPEYGTKFLFVGGMEAGKRSMRQAVIAKATGLTAGHPDITIFLPRGRCAFIENKTTKGRLSPVQRDRHEALRAIGHVVEVIVSGTPNDAAKQAVEFVRSVL